MVRNNAILLALILSVGVATLAFGQGRPSSHQSGTQPAPGPTAPGPDASDQIKTGDQLKRESVQGAATAPLRDLNVMKTPIPEILLQALDAPYARPPRNWRCSTLAALVRPLDAALGPDIDQTPVEDDDLMDRGKQTALGVAGDLASGAIPFRGVVRRLSGAYSHDRLVQSAIIAGNVRRAYLKGLGEARGCPSPASPLRQIASAPQKPVAEIAGAKPKYPTRTDAPKKRDGNFPSDPRRSLP